MELVSPAKTLTLLQKYRIPHAKQFLAKTEDEALSFAKKLPFPLAMKISSPDISHKTEAKGVFLNIKSEEEIKDAFSKIMKNAKAFKKNAKIDGILLQEQLSGKELIVGSKQDSQFGPVLMFGLGGIFVEVLKDVSFRLIPVERKDVHEMVEEIKGYPLLKGARGERAVSLGKLEEFLLAVSKMVEKSSIKELDLNPVFANEKGCWAADVRIVQ